MAVQAREVGREIGFSTEFLDPPPEHLLQSECPVCLHIIREPHQVTCCGYSYCKSCIDDIKATNKRCPTCKAENCTDFPNKDLKRKLYSFKARCSYHRNGCEWTGELGQLDVHLNRNPEQDKLLDGCQLAEVVCQFCEEGIERRAIQKHQAEVCSKRPFGCEYCNSYQSNYDDVVKSHWSVCGAKPVSCPNECGAFPQRQNIERHVAEECPLTAIACDFHHVGCQVKLPHKDMPQHLNDSFLTHISLLATSHAKQQVLITEQQARIVDQQNEIERLKESNVALAKEVEESNEELSRVKNAMKSLSSPAMPRITNPFDPSVLTMTEFQKHKAENQSWYSTPVYTHHEGYKICLKVYAGGLNNGLGSHVSVFVYFMRGDYDDDLIWPFRGVIRFRLLDQVRGVDHKTYRNVYDECVEDKYCNRVVDREISSAGRGPTQFISHIELEPTYLQNDILLFQIHEVTI